MKLIERIRRSGHKGAAVVFLLMTAALLTVAAVKYRETSDYFTYVDLAADSASYDRETNTLTLTRDGTQATYACDESLRRELEEWSEELEIVGVALAVEVPRRVVSGLGLDPDAAYGFEIIEYPEMEEYIKVYEVFWRQE